MIQLMNYKMATNLLINLANKQACAHQYKSWSDKTCRQEIIESNKTLSEKYEIDFVGYTPEQLKSLGLTKWSEEEDLYLLPLWIVPFLKKGLKLKSIDGEEVIVGETDFDCDIRFGCIAYGIELANEENK